MCFYCYGQTPPAVGRKRFASAPGKPTLLILILLGKIGDSYSLEVATTAHVTPFFLTFFGCHHCFASYLSHTPMSRVSKNTHLIDSLSETTRFANSNLLNISLTHFASINTYSRERFSLVIYHTCKFIINCTHRQLRSLILAMTFSVTQPYRLVKNTHRS
jgi:hypothetical protein